MAGSIGEFLRVFSSPKKGLQDLLDLVRFPALCGHGVNDHISDLGGFIPEVLEDPLMYFGDSWRDHRFFSSVSRVTSRYFRRASWSSGSIFL
jgi:hypothetical protein